MRSREFLRRIDGHIAETTRHIAETKVHIAETKVHIAETKTHIAETKELIEGIKLDMRQREARWIRVYRDQSKVMNDLLESSKKGREENRVHTAALLALIDEIKGPPPAQA